MNVASLLTSIVQTGKKRRRRKSKVAGEPKTKSRRKNAAGDDEDEAEEESEPELPSVLYTEEELSATLHVFDEKMAIVRIHLVSDRR